MKTNNRNALFSFDRSADLLKELYPDENWFWFLTKNIHGLTEGYSTIPYDNNTSDIAYELSDIENFAVTPPGASPSLTGLTDVSAAGNPSLIPPTANQPGSIY